MQPTKLHGADSPSGIQENRDFSTTKRDIGDIFGVSGVVNRYLVVITGLKDIVGVIGRSHANVEANSLYT